MFYHDSILPKPTDVTIKKSGVDLKILHLSDLHIDKKSSLKKLEDLVALTNSMDIDFVVITGDIIDTKVKNIVEKLNILRGIKKRVYYISGNHDIVYGIKELVKLFRSFGFIYLDNRRVVLKVGEKEINLVGIRDRYSPFFGYKRRVSKVLRYLDERDTILLSHQPKDIDIAIKGKTFLHLCGHTHAGQIYPFNYLVKLVQPYLNGLHYKNGCAVYVNSGLGCWGVDFRFIQKSEIAKITVES